MRRTLDILVAAFLFLLLVLYSLPSLALQPVEAFVAGDGSATRTNGGARQPLAGGRPGRLFAGPRPPRHDPARGLHAQTSTRPPSTSPSRPAFAAGHPGPQRSMGRERDPDGAAHRSGGLSPGRRRQGERAGGRTPAQATPAQVEGQVIQDYLPGGPNAPWSPPRRRPSTFPGKGSPRPGAVSGRHGGGAGSDRQSPT